MTPATAATLARLIYAGAAHIAESGNAAGAAADLAEVRLALIKDLHDDVCAAFVEGCCADPAVAR